MVAPGMTCQYIVQFFPDCLGDFDDFISVETQSAHTLLIPLKARRPPPVLTCECVLCLPWHSVGAGGPCKDCLLSGPLHGSTQLVFLGRSFCVLRRDLLTASVQPSIVSPDCPAPWQRLMLGYAIRRSG